MPPPPETSSTPPPHLYFNVPPEPSHLLRARERLRDYLRQYCTEQRVIDDLVLCVEEACTNAIRHSGSDADITISLAFDDGLLAATVKDQGAAFDVARFDPAATPDPTVDHGRGLYIIAALMDSLRLVVDGGLEVHMARRAVPSCAPAVLESGIGGQAGTAGHRNARTRAMLEEIDEAFLAFDWEYRAVHVNGAALRLTGKSRDELLGHTPWEVFPQLRESPLAEHYRAAMELGMPSVFEHRSVASGDWLEVRIYPTEAGVSAYYREIAERKRMEQEVVATKAELAATLAAITDGFYTLDRDWRVTYLNDRAATVFPGGKEALGADFRELFPDAAGSEFEVNKRRAMELGEVRAFEAYYPAFDTWYEERDYPSEQGVTVLFTDIGERKRSELERDRLLAREHEALEARVAAERSARHELETASLLLEAATAAASWADLDQMLGALGDLLLRSIDHERILLELWDADAREVEIAVSRGSAATPRERFAFDRISDGAKRAIATQTTVVIDYTQTGLPEPQKQYVDEHAFLLMLVVPMVYRERLVGLITVDQPAEHREFSAREIELVEAFAAQAGAAIANARLYGESLQRARLAEALNDIGDLIHSTLEFDDIMRRAMERGVRTLGSDAGAIEMREAGSWVVRYQYGFSADDVGLRLADAEAPNAMTAERRKSPVVIADLAADATLNVGFVKAHALRSVLAVPLLVREAVIGCLLFYGRQTRVFGEAEIDFARKLGTTVSFAIENAQLYAAQQGIALTLQEHFLHPLPTAPGLEFAAVSATAFEPSLVGGDFHDAFPLPDGRLFLVMGDVMGKGVRAAGLTETTRTAVRAVALTLPSPSPGAVLALVNRLIASETDQLVTTFLALLDVTTGEARLASAGHPPPVHLAADGATALVAMKFGPPLGAAGRVYPEGGLRLAPGDALVLYTDGVTEARRRGELFGEDRLVRTLAAAADRRPQVLVDAVRDAVAAFADRLTDDVDVLALRRLG